jgi:uncharacterized heparinase superfamily protein
MDTPLLQAVSQIVLGGAHRARRGHPHWHGLALAAANGMNMVREITNPAELEAIIKAEARRIGPRPDNMQVIVYSLDDSWRAMFGYSHDRQISYRNEVAVVHGTGERYDGEETDPRGDGE